MLSLLAPHALGIPHILEKTGAPPGGWWVSNLSLPDASRTGALVEPGPRAAATCQNWCSQHTADWSTKCYWGDGFCSNCTECSAVANCKPVRSAPRTHHVDEPR